MSKFKSSSFLESFVNAQRGLKLALRSQRNFVIELLVAFIVMFTSIFLKFSYVEISILLVMCALVLVCELINSVIEFTLDAVYKNNYSKLVEMAKDMSSGMVLLVSIISVLVGILIFGSHLMAFFNK